MTSLKSTIYRKACKELHEILINMSEEEKSKIPESYFEYIEYNMDKTYEFKYDKTKSLAEQELMLQTQAILIGIYKKYLINNESEKEINYLNKYDNECDRKIEIRKRELYNPDNIFTKDKKEENNIDDSISQNLINDDLLLANLRKENVFEKLIKFFKEKRY